MSINITPKQHLIVPIVQTLRCEGESFPHAAQDAPHNLQSGSLAEMLDVPLLLQPVDLELSEGKQLQKTLGQTSLCIIVAFCVCMCQFSVNILFQKLHPRTVQYYTLLEKKL